MNSPAHDLFARALELPEAERDAFLSEACGGDAELHLEVRRLLVDAARADALFGDTEGETRVGVPGSASGDPSSSTEKEGDRIGPYILRQQIGEGGFGVVWMAEQRVPISRMVALKVVKAGMDTKQVLARFEAERQALAMMEHPNIARVLDAGATDQGRPYFVMELVKGIPISQYCDEAGLGTRERLALFGDVCSAIQHAHQKGIIHRDIKPSNVMVTLYADKPIVKVIDFGIAKATQGKLTDQTLFTRFEQFIGTPVYMSPEQASLSAVDIDTRSDIYALGILLYELLTGKPPFDAHTLASAGYDEMRRIIREVEPPRPSSRLSTVAGEERTTIAKARHVAPDKLSRLVEADLDWIVMKAIEKDRARRYETANGLAADIGRFLADEPVTARPPSAGYQFRKFARRNKAALRVAAAIAAVLVAATLVSTWQAIRATRAEKRATDTLVEVAAERDAKDLARKDAEAISTFLTEVFQSPDPTRDGRTITVAETLDTAAKKLETDLVSQPGRRASLQATLGRTYEALGLARQAIPLLEKARDYHLARSGSEHPGTLNAMASLASSYRQAGRRDEAIKLQEEVLPLSRKVLGPEHPDSLKAQANLANSYFDAGREDEALQLKEEVLPLSRKVNGPEHPLTLAAMTNMANSYFAAGRRDEAIKLQEEVLPLSRKVNGPAHPDTLKAQANLANSYFAAGRRDEALKLREEVLPLTRKVNGPEHPDTLTAVYSLAISYAAAGREYEALKLREEALVLYRKVNGPEHPGTLTAMGGLANSYFAAGREEEALKMREEVLPLSRKVNGPEHPDTLMVMGNLAISHFATSREAEALKLQEEVLTLSRKVNGPEHCDTIMATTNLANSYFAAGRKDEALKLHEEVLPLSRKVNGPEHPDTLRAMHNLALTCHDAGRRDEALKLHEEVLTLSRKVNGPEHADTLKAMINLGGSYAFADREAEAIKLLEEALPLGRKLLGPGDAATPPAVNFLADLYEKAGRKEEAHALRAELAGKAAADIKTLEAALDLARKDRGPEHADTIAAMTALAAGYGADGSGSQAIKLGEEALALARRVLPAGAPLTIKAMKTLIPLYNSVDLTGDAAQLEAEVATLTGKK